MIIDCYHNDITAIVNARIGARLSHKFRNFVRYERKHGRKVWPK